MSRSAEYMFYDDSRTGACQPSVIATSTDGGDWIVSEPSQTVWYSVCYADSPRIRTLYSAPIFAGICRANNSINFATSTDGINWTFTPMNITFVPSLITFCSPSSSDDGLFITHSYTSVMTSVDGITWSTVDTSACNSDELGGWMPISFTYGRIGDHNCYIFTNTFGWSDYAYITITTDFNDWITYPLTLPSGRRVETTTIKNAVACCGDGKYIAICPHHTSCGYVITLSDMGIGPGVDECDVLNHWWTSIVYGPSTVADVSTFIAVSNDGFCACSKDGDEWNSYRSPLMLLNSVCQSPARDGSYIAAPNSADRDSQLLKITCAETVKFEPIKVANGQKWIDVCEGGGRIIAISSQMDGSCGKFDDTMNAFIIAVNEPVEIGDFVTCAGVKVADEDAIKLCERGCEVYVVQRTLPGSYVMTRMQKMRK